MNAEKETGRISEESRSMLSRSARLMLDLRDKRDDTPDPDLANLLRRAIMRIERLERLAQRMLE